MRALEAFLVLVLEFLLPVVLAGLSGELDVDDETEGRRRPIPDAPVVTQQHIECATCGKPNQAQRVYCKSCGAPLGEPGTREMDVNDEEEGSEQPVPVGLEAALELADCAGCGKPNPIEHVFCKHCGALLETGKGIFGLDGQGKRRLLVLATPEGIREFVDCTKCGRSNQAEHVFCKACGALL